MSAKLTKSDREAIARIIPKLPTAVADPLAPYAAERRKRGRKPEWAAGGLMAYWVAIMIRAEPPRVSVEQACALLSKQLEKRTSVRLSAKRLRGLHAQAEALFKKDAGQKERAFQMLTGIRAQQAKFRESLVLPLRFKPDSDIAILAMLYNY